jgi:translation initiation factor IF-2
MARARVHELAKSWGMESKDLLSQIEKIGIQGKRSQSSLSEGEVERIQGELGLGDQPQVTVGEERVVTGETGQQVVERRVGAKVIRRRVRAEAAPMEGAMEPLQPLGVQSDVLAAFAAPEALPPVEPIEPMPLPPPSEEPLAAPERVAAPVEVPARPVEVETPPVAQTAPPARAATPESAPSPPFEAAPPPPLPAAVKPAEKPAPPSAQAKAVGPKVLGRIDLRKVEAERLAATRGRSTAADTRGRRTAQTPQAPQPQGPMDLPPPGRQAQAQEAPRHQETGVCRARRSRSPAWPAFRARSARHRARSRRRPRSPRPRPASASCASPRSSPSASSPRRWASRPARSSRS